MSKRTPGLPHRRGGGKGITFLNATLLSDSDDCIEWPFYRMKNGYGQVGLHTGMALAHRKMCEMAHGRPHDGQQAAHSCGNRACVNPKHLRWADQAQNEADKLQHGTWFSRMGGAKLEADTVRAIRAMFSAGTSNREISDHFAVPHKTVGNITSGRTWKHV